MTRRDLVSALPALAFAQTRQQRPNVILIMSDDAGWWDIGVNGNPHAETPVIDRLATQGVRFTHFHASAVCTPTRASLLTGRHYQRTGAVDTINGFDVLDPGEVTIGDVLRRHGYRTACIGKWHLGRYAAHHPNRRGFDDFLGFPFGMLSRYDDTDELYENRHPVVTRGYVTDVFTDRAITFIEQNRRNPFFLYLAYNAPHGPYLVPDSYIERFLKKGLPLDQARIYGMNACVDENVGRLLSTLDSTGLADNTIVLFMTDNGGVSRHFRCGLRGAKGSPYEGGVRVPLIARWPGRFPAGKVVDAMAQHIDLFPTICEATGAQTHGRPLDGRSILPLLDRGGGESPHQLLFHQFNRFYPVITRPASVSDYVPARLKPLVRPNWSVRNAAGLKLMMSGELYDLRRDPGESTDIAAAHPDVVKELRGGFERWFEDVTRGRTYGPPPIEVGRADEDPVEIDVTWGLPVGRAVHSTSRAFHRDVIEGWTTAGESVRWAIDVARPGRYAVTLTYGCAPADAGSKLRVSAGGRGFTYVVEATAGAHVYRRFAAGVLELAKGPATLEFRAESIPGRECMVLHKVALGQAARPG